MQFVCKPARMVIPLPVVDIHNFIQKDIEVKFRSDLMSSTIMEIALLKSLAHGKRFLEIGTHFGLTMKNIAEVAKECIAIDNDPIAGKYCKDLTNVELICANSTKFDWNKLGKFDLIYIDGDHQLSTVFSDTVNAFNSLRDMNSIIVWDDYATRHGASFGVSNWIREDVYWGMLDGIPSIEHDKLYHVSNTKAIIYTHKYLPVVNYQDIEVKILLKMGENKS